MKQSQIAEIVKGKILHPNEDMNLTGKIEIDSRKVDVGDLFIAIIGKTLDGHEYVKEAVEKGAKCVIVSRVVEGVLVPTIQVEDTTQAFMDLAYHHKKECFHGSLVAITGSVGKTTTKEMVSAILEKTYRVKKSIGNHNNHIGVPLTLLNLTEEDEICVVEMGMNHAGEIHRLSLLGEPDVSLITKIGSAHIGYLGSMENIKRAKLEIIDGMKEGTLFLNGDDSYLKKVNQPSEIKIIRCGTNRTSNLKAIHIKSGIDSLEFDLKIKHHKYHFIYPHGGLHFLQDLLLAIGVGLQFQVPIEKIQEAIKELPIFEKRLERIPLMYGNILIDDTYNASFESVIADIDYVDQFKEKKMIFFGDILEVGDHGIEIHKKIAKRLKKCKNTEAVCVGTYSKVISDLLPFAIHYESTEQMIEALDYMALEQTVILVKGSRKMNLEKVVTEIKKRYKKEN